MSRIIIDSANYARERVIEGWYDPTKAVLQIDEPTRWDGSNQVGVMTGLPRDFAWCTLYRTRGGRWVERRDTTDYFNGRDVSAFLTDEQAEQWLMSAAEHDDDAAAALSRYFGEPEPERGPGRKRIGSPMNLTVPDDVIAAADAAAAERSVDRSVVLREWLVDGQRAAVTA